MAVAIQADPIGYGDMEAGERNGSRNYLKRYLLVTGLTKTDSRVTDEIWDALEATYPAGHSLTDNQNLVCVNRHVRVMCAKGAPSKAVVTLEYAARGEAEVDCLLSFEGSLRQVQTEKDGLGVPLAVSYTYPVDYPYNTSLQETTVTQGAEASVLYPSQVIRGTRYLRKTYPHQLIQEYLDRVNATEWIGIPAGCALCTNIRAQMHDWTTTPRTWKFAFELLVDWAGHQPDVVFRDPNTGVPPNDLVPGTGYYTATWYPTAEFNNIFPTP